jgi:type IV secretion system protein VirB9
MISAMKAAPKFVAATQVEDYRQQVDLAKQETREAKRAAQATVDREVSKYREEYPTNLKFAYHFERDKKPFQVTSIYHDDKFTYIQASPEETPALYEVKDGKPNLINFEYRNGTYIVDRIMDSGYLAIGKARMNFSRAD